MEAYPNREIPSTSLSDDLFQERRHSRYMAGAIDMTSYRVISADSHVFEPPELWTERIEPRYRERAPHVVLLDDGYWWVYEGRMGVGLGSGAQAGRRFEAPEKMTHGDIPENLHPGGYIPEEHVKDMDVDGLAVSILYPTVGLRLYTVDDGDLLSSIFRAYNEWLAEFCQQFPDRLKGIAMLNLDDVQVGVKELERCAKMGLVGAVITIYPPEDKAYDSPNYEPFWAAAQDLRMPLSLHISTNRPGPGQQFSDTDTIKPPFLCNVDHWARMSLSNIIFSGVFERYPKLQIGSVEQELSWVPHFVDRMDYTYTQRVQIDPWYRFKEDTLPSDYFHRNVFLGFQEDGLGIRLRDVIGVDSLMWGSDYPHHESTFPRSRQILEESLVDCTEKEKAKIAGGNAARVYNLD